MDFAIREATTEDRSAVEEMTASLWTDRGGDYLPRVYDRWLAPEDPNTRTLVAEHDGRVVGIVQAVVLSATEAWLQGMRVHPDARRMGVSTRLNEACFDWVRERGTTVARVMVFSWNTDAIAAARACGFEPVTSARWAIVERGAAGGVLGSDARAAWEHWSASRAHDHLRGLGLAPEESWAVRELEPWDLEGCSLVATDDTGVSAVAARTRTVTEAPSRVEYGLASWDDLEGARRLVDAVRTDVAQRGCDEGRVFVADTPLSVCDAAAGGAAISEEALYVLETTLD